MSGPRKEVLAEGAGIGASTEDDAREQLAAWMIARSFATGHGDTFTDLLNELSAQIEALYARLP